MKQFITLKVGYTRSKMYGLSGEYFTTILINGDKITSLHHYGMYGSEERINRALEAKGYKSVYVSSDYGLMTQKNIWRGFISEAEAIKEIEKI